MKKNKGNMVEKAESCFSFLKNKDQRIDWLIIGLSCLVGFIIVKMCYPYPSTMSDSGTYVASAAQDMFTFYRPFGFSVFLQIMHLFSSSIFSVFIFQIILYFLSASFFAMTVKYFIPPTNRILWRILLFFFIFSPISFYMANAIMSDLLFSATIYIMLAAFLFVIKQKSWIGLGVFLLFLFFSLHVRYSAIIFPITFIGCAFFIKGHIRWVAIAATVIVVLFFQDQIKDDMKQTVGIRQYSTGFDGWQLANNALPIEPFVEIDPNTIKDKEVREVHLFVSQYNDMILEKTKNGTDPVASFMWINDQPLKQYLYYYLSNTNEPYPVAWVKIGSGRYKKYGQYMITKYPGKFLQHYYIPNSKQVFYPDKTGLICQYKPIEVKDIKAWYNVRENANLEAKYPTLYEKALNTLIPISHLLIWIVMAATTVIAIIYRKKLGWERDDKIVFWCLLTFGIIYYAATVFASPIELRFWLPMNAIQFGFLYILGNKLILIAKKSK